MKTIESQIKFIDTKLLPVYGIKTIVDYSSIVTVKNITNLNKINKLLDSIKKAFGVKSFSLHKTNNKIETSMQAFNLLRKCLITAQILFETCGSGESKQLRLLPLNISLYKYTNKMSEIPQNLGNVYGVADFALSENEMAKKFERCTITKQMMEDNIKKRYTEVITMNGKHLEHENNTIYIDLRKIGMNNKNITSINVKCLSLKDPVSGKQYLHDTYIETFFTHWSIGNGKDNMDTYRKITNGTLKDHYIMPLFAVQYHDVLFSLKCLNERLLQLIKLELTIEYASFYKEFEDKIRTTNIAQKIYDDDGCENTLNIVTGMFGNNCKYYVQMKSANKIISLGKYTGELLDKLPMGSYGANYDYKYDFWTITGIFGKQEIYSANNKIILRKTLCEWCQSVSNIKITNIPDENMTFNIIDRATNTSYDATTRFENNSIYINDISVTHQLSNSLDLVITYEGEDECIFDDVEVEVTRTTWKGVNYNNENIYLIMTLLHTS
jgi:hypothetical protein